MVLILSPSEGIVEAQVTDTDGGNPSEIRKAPVQRHVLEGMAARFRGMFTLEQVDRATIDVDYVGKVSKVSVFYTAKVEGGGDDPVKLSFNATYNH